MCSCRATPCSIHAGRYGEGPFNYVKDGTQAARITWKAVGGQVMLGHFFDLDDATATPVDGMPGVYALPYTPIAGKTSQGIFQTYFDPIVVDDASPGNATVFTMVDTDGPLRLKGVASTADLVHPGTARYENGRYLIHPYTNRTPGPTTTDFVLAFADGGQIEADWNVFEDFTVRYTGAYNALAVTGRANVLRRIRYEGVPFLLQGSSNRTEDAFVAHVIDMGEKFTFDYSGAGTAVIVFGAGHTLLRTTAIHSWNANVQVERADKTLIDGAVMHGSPNHCGVGTVGATGDDNIFRNVVMWNCQDYAYWERDQRRRDWRVGAGACDVCRRRVLPKLRRRAGGGADPDQQFDLGRDRELRQPARRQYQHALRSRRCARTKASMVIEPASSRRRPRSTAATRWEGLSAGRLHRAVRAGRVHRLSSRSATTGSSSRRSGPPWSRNGRSRARTPGMRRWCRTRRPSAWRRRAPTQDVRGMARPQGDAPDAGAYEFPLGKCEVSAGAAWQAGPWTEHGVSTRTREESRTRTVTTPGTELSAADRNADHTEACTALATTLPPPGGFAVACTAWLPRGTALRRGAPPTAPPPDPPPAFEREPTAPPEARPPPTPSGRTP